MVTSGNRRYGEPILVGPKHTIAKPRRIPFTEKKFEEGWLQELIRANPELLPVVEIEPAFTPHVDFAYRVIEDMGKRGCVIEWKSAS
jgi:hypothetical protein